MNGKLSNVFSIDVDVRQGCFMPSWLFKVYIDGVVRDEGKVGIR